MAKLYLQLATGDVFVGESAGTARDVTGELVFTTGVTGCPETVTDPRYVGQIVVCTYPLFGNYGMIDDDALSGKPTPAALIVHELCDAPANYRCAGTFGDYLKKNKAVCMTGVDTRALTAILRTHGTMPARITRKKPEGGPDEAWLAYRVTDAVSAVASRATGIHPARGETKHRVTVIDCGLRLPLVSALTAQGCMVTVCPPTASVDALQASRPDGIVVTPGPGDPRDNAALIETLRALRGKFPMLGVGLGHQLLALAAGAAVVKLSVGHRGTNQPVRDLATGRVCITAQNHGYAVDPATLPEGAELRMVNVNDGSCEGIDYPAARAFGVQYDPLTADGCLGAPTLARFISLLEEVDGNAL